MFRRGNSGECKQFFTSKHVNCVKEIASDLLIDLDDEEDLIW